MTTSGDDEAMLEIGTVTRAHGLRGEVVVRLVTNRLERVEPGSVLTVSGRPMTVAASRQDRGRWLVRFEGVEDRRAAEALRGLITAPPLDDATEMWAHELIGSRVVDGGTDRGEIVALQENPASDLLVLDSGALVPLRFVTGVSDGLVRVDVPDGLFDLLHDTETGGRSAGGGDGTAVGGDAADGD